jgi:hypothetical protein
MKIQAQSVLSNEAKRIRVESFSAGSFFTVFRVKILQKFVL